MDKYDERAEKIIRHRGDLFIDGGVIIKQEIAAALRESVEEARHKPMGQEEIREREFGCGHDADCSCYANGLKQQARASALEEAARVAEDQVDREGMADCCDKAAMTIASKIRALAKEAK